MREVSAEEYGKHSILARVIGNNLGEIEGVSGTSAPDVSYLSSQTTITAGAGVAEDLEEVDILGTISGERNAITTTNPIDSGGAMRYRTDIEEYVVEGGDTISTIAAKFNISVNTVLWENKLSARDVIRPGNKLRILPISGVSHKVVARETLSSIAKKYSADQEKILEYNDLESEDGLEIGQTLIIPGGSIAPEPPPVRAPVRAPIASVRNLLEAPRPPNQQNTGSGKMTWPTSSQRVNRYYNYRHNGIDIGGNTGNPIYAADDGRVIKSVTGGWNGGYGIHIIIDHGGGIHSLYAHLSKTHVRAGDSVKRGQTIGALGSTGNSTGPHLHFEIRSNGRKINPISYIR